MNSIPWGLVATALACLTVSSMPNRPIWIDETAEFSLGAYATTAEAWHAFIRSASSLNHGQTGAFYMLGHWLMRAFGANVFILRLPSLLTAAFLFYVARVLFTILRLPLAWQYFGFLALFSHPWIEGYFHEARPYIQLAAATAGLLAFYFVPPAERRGHVRAVGWVSAVLGAVFHPFFSVYWVFVATVGFLRRRFAEGRWPRLIPHLDPALCVAGVALYFAIGLPTWIGHPAAQFSTFDPFLFVPKQWSVGRYLYASHFLFLRMFKIPITLVFGGAAVGLLFRRRSPLIRRCSPELVPLLYLFLGSLLLSAFLAYLSYRQSYWILERQWIASMTLVTLGTAWFLALIARELPKRWARVFTGAVLALAAVNACVRAGQDIQQMMAWHDHPADLSGISATTRITDIHDDWEKLAQANCRQGGPVWPEFKKMF